MRYKEPNTTTTTINNNNDNSRVNRLYDENFQKQIFIAFLSMVWARLMANIIQTG